MFEADLVARAVAIGIVGDEVSWRVRRKNGSLPAIVFHQIDPGRSYSHDGPDQLHNTRVQATCLGRTPTEAAQIAAALTEALEPPHTVGGTRFGYAFLNGSPDLPAEEIDGGQTAFCRAPDLSIWHQPA